MSTPNVITVKPSMSAGAIKAKPTMSTEPIKVKSSIRAQTGGAGTSDYEQLANKPQINGVELVGNKTASQLGLATPSDIPAVPTKVSDLTNDSGFVNASGAAAAAPVQSVNGNTGAVTITVPEAASSGTPAMDGIASAGSSAAYARGDHVHPVDTSRLAANQGTANAGCFLVVGSDGVVTPVTMQTWQGGNY